MTTTAGVYVHIPFCAKKCGYCDFNAYSGYKDATKARYVDALVAEIGQRGDKSLCVPTVFFGGGTPTTLSAHDLGRILQAVKNAFSVDANAELSLEANPSQANLPYLCELKAAGFNRVSFGVQTFDDRLLPLIDRDHSASDAQNAIGWARDAGFDNFSLDLMFGLPRQSVDGWEKSLHAAFALNVPHLSLYGLIVEENTPFWARRERNKLPLPSEDDEVAMFARALDLTCAAGYNRYEISNYALPGFESRHNQIYWRNESYVGVGAGAASYLAGVRTVNEKRPPAYIERVLAGQGVFAESETLPDNAVRGETFMLGLRLAQGVDLNAFAQRFGVRAEDLWASEIARFVDGGFLEQTATHLRLRRRGLFVASEIMAAFLV